MTKDTGGPAFPTHGAIIVYEGMSLRDYFAANAMRMKFGKTGTDMPLATFAANCYEMADAMLAERAKP